MAIAVIETLNFGLGYLVDAARSRGHDLFLLTCNRGFYQHELARAESVGVNVVDVDTSDVVKVVSALRNIADLQGIVRMTDLWSMPAIEAAEQLGLPRQSGDAVALLRSKGELRDHLHNHGFSRAPSVVFDPYTTEAGEVSKQLGYPCVVKDVAGSSSQNVWLVKTPSDLRPVIDAARKSAQVRGGALTAEPYFVGPLYSAETLSWGGETRILGITSRSLSPEPYFREDTLSFPVAFPEAKAKELVDWVGSILSTVGYREGFTHTEFIVTSEGFEIVEINPRLGGALVGESIHQTFGVNVHEAFIDLALGKRPALMDAQLMPQRGTAQVLVYAQEVGVFEGFAGEELLAHHPGEPTLYPLRRPGDFVPSTTDQTGAVAVLFATGASAELALHNVVSALGKLGVHTKPEGK
ncbi:ATP-grasp domain-containing protein [Streptomyces sp. DSM 42041]|uniref:ATP-grasp domain-containing protein n=1 Tax=Streptomyces hazeniae TaxID=3075538 RepID=A0ABU2NYV4_9ACTN|nr:ATP-grasp domain-containing protein [Streptomyces sp. DSM 42041]MDT0382164.1 ATP-grasp domain-containing protein [Streptomyces sp. DSM 42041]